VLQQVIGGDRVHPDAHATQCAPRHLFAQHGLVAEIAAGATLFLRNVDAQKAELASPPSQVVPDMPAPARLDIMRQHLAFGEADPGVAKAFDRLRRSTSA
jgi:hypothetical protein